MQFDFFLISEILLEIWSILFKIWFSYSYHMNTAAKYSFNSLLI